jgi:multiple sugar transport system permease protein
MFFSSILFFLLRERDDGYGTTSGKKRKSYAKKGGAA